MVNVEIKLTKIMDNVKLHLSEMTFRSMFLE